MYTLLLLLDTYLLLHKGGALLSQSQEYNVWQVSETYTFLIMLPYLNARVIRVYLANVVAAPLRS